MIDLSGKCALVGCRQQAVDCVGDCAGARSSGCAARLSYQGRFEDHVKELSEG